MGTSSDILTVIDEFLVPNAGTPEGRVFYFKMKGDYLRYLAEFQVLDKKKDSAAKALDAYQNFKKQLVTVTTVCHQPIEFVWVLPLTFLFSNTKSRTTQNKHVNLLKAFDDAIAELDTLSEESYKDSTLIMQLLRDNLTLWTSDNDGDGQDQSDMRVENL